MNPITGAGAVGDYEHGMKAGRDSYGIVAIPDGRPGYAPTQVRERPAFYIDLSIKTDKFRQGYTSGRLAGPWGNIEPVV